MISDIPPILNNNFSITHPDITLSMNLIGYFNFKLIKIRSIMVEAKIG